MVHRSSRLLTALALGALPLATFPLAASAQTSKFYSPPKIVKYGKATTPVAGSGVVELKVFVKKNGSVGNVQVLNSTNHGDDKAAMEIAQTSTYKPGSLDAKPEDAFYTIKLRFNGSSFQADTGSTSTDVNSANALLHAGKYAEAKTQLQAYLTAHPGDKNAEALLGVADTYLNDPTAAASDFDQAGTIPSTFTAVAAKAYADAAISAIKAKNYDQAQTLAQKSSALQPSANAYYVQGVAALNAQQYDKAASSLEHARSIAQSGKADAKTLNAIDEELVQAYVMGGQQQKGLELAQELKRREPSNTQIDNAIAASYNQQAQAAAKSGNTSQAVADLEAGAKAAPGSAAILYVNAAQIMAQSAKSTDDWKRVKAEADKALAIEPNSAPANYIEGIALGNSGDLNGAKSALQKAKANVGSDAQLSAQIDAQLAQLAKLGQK
jgi:tetratricopeptide (TPR) repeat protein